MTAPISPQMRESLFTLRYPRSLGTFSTYDEVQAVVDALADHDFPVQNTMIVGTDLKQVERVTGRRTWGGVIRDGIVSGIWMGLFVGILFWMTSQNAGSVLIAVVMGIVFFTVWSVIRYAMTSGKRDFTSLTATIPLQYELLVEHSDAEAARRVLSDAGVRLPADPAAAPRTGAHGGPSYGQAGPSYGQGGPAGQPAGGYGQPAGSAQHGSYGQPAGAGSPRAGSARPTYGRPASAPSPGGAPDAPEQASQRPSFGQPGPASQQSGAGTQQPGPAAQQPDPAPRQPGAATQQPGGDSQQPGPSARPGAESQQPGPSAQPAGDSQQPGPSTQPGAETDRSEGRHGYGYGEPGSDGRPGADEHGVDRDEPRR